VKEHTSVIKAPQDLQLTYSLTWSLQPLFPIGEASFELNLRTFIWPLDDVGDSENIPLESEINLSASYKSDL
jgi:hypothetical protein